MPNPVSLYIDLLRFSAALAVFIGHCGYIFLPQMGRAAYHAQEAVAVFFVLSGFVIGYVSERRETTAKSYVTARALRMYSVLPLALCVTYICDYLGGKADPIIYDGLAFWKNSETIVNFLSVLTFTNEFWRSHYVFGSNEPLWSLSFEVAYYALFGAIFYTRGALRIGLVIAWAAIVGPSIVLYAPLWLLGLATWKLARNDMPTRVGNRIVAGVVLVLTPVIYLLIRKLFAIDGTRLAVRVPSDPFWMAPAYFFTIGLAVSASIIAVKVLADGWKGPSKGVAFPIRWLAGMSFTLYTMHLPIVLCGLALFPKARTDFTWGLGLMAAVVVCCAVLAELGERRKNTFQALLAAINSVLFHRKGATAREI